MKQYIIKHLKGFSDTPELDARFFLEDHPKATAAQADDFIARRRVGEPVAKILGHCGFWTLDLAVSKDTLDPRPDSETMIDAVLRRFQNRDASLSVLDIGTGSGCLLLAVLSEYKNAHGIGIDVSDATLRIARQNADKYGFKAEFSLCDFMKEEWTQGLGKYDIILSNPPYITTDDVLELSDSVKKYDPMTALDGGADGLDAYRALAKSISVLLKTDGRVFFEIGQGQERDVTELMRAQGFAFVDVHRDLAGIVRVLEFKR